MRVVHIAYHYGTDNTGGATIASTRLHRALLAVGVDSHYVCVNAREAGDGVHVLPTGFRRRLRDVLSLAGRACCRLSPLRRSVHLNLVPMFGLERLLRSLRPDLVHVHWINDDVISLRQLARLGETARCPVVVNLHDLYLLTALTVHPNGDRRCREGYRRGNSSWFERWFFGRKRRALARLRPTMLAPSAWAAYECRESLIGRDLSVRVVRNLVGTGFDGVVPTVHGRFVILFGANGGRSQPLKGFDDLLAALAELPKDVRKDCELQIFGEPGTDCEMSGVPVRFLGVARTVDELRAIYAGADVFAFPSRCETQGLAKVEAMRSGLPVVAFDRTACADGIRDGETGSVVADGDVAGFAAALGRWHAIWRTGGMPSVRARVAEVSAADFDDRTTVASLMRVYEDVVGK